VASLEMAEERRQGQAINYFSHGHRMMKRKHTKGGLRYSIPTLRALRDVLRISLIRLYLSILKLSVGPSDKRTIRREGAMGVRVKASKWVTCSAGARTR
jgi:hypothetical protein